MPTLDEAQIRLFAAIAPVGIFITNAAGEAIFVNERWCEFAGLDPAQALENGWRNSLHPEDAERVVEEWIACVARGENYSSEYRYRRSDGKVTWVLAQAVPINGAGSGYIATVTDITTRKKIEAERERANLFLDSIFENIPNMLFIKEAQELRFVRFNKAGEFLLTIMEEDLIGKNDYDLFPVEQADFFTSKDRAVLASGEQLLVAEEPIDTPTRGRRILRTRKMPLETSDGQRYLLGISEDITAEIQARDTLRRSEELFRRISDAAPVLVWMAGPDAQCTFVNKGWIEFTGCPLEDHLGERWGVDVHPDDVKKCRDAYLTSFYRRDSFKLEYRLRRADGVFRWIVDHGVPNCDDEGVFLGYIGSCFDVTDQRESAEQLRCAKEAAEAATTAKSLFLANMSHEIRTPMNAILGMTELVLDSSLTPEQHENLETVHSAATSLLEILNDLLDLSKIEAGKTEITHQPFNLAHLIDDVRRLFTLSARERKLSFEISCDDTLPAFLIGDTIRLRQVLVNIIANAIKFTAAGGSVAVRVACEEKNDEGVLLQFAVHDTGIGIPLEKQLQIFEAFAQADPSITRTYGGTGLGLAISHRLVSMMGGDLTVESTEGVGSTFYFTIRFPYALTSVIERSRRNEFSGEAGQPPVAKLRVLLVEDNPVNRKLASRLLEKRGHEVIQANDGQLALSLLETESFDLVLMDMQMPRMDGLSATQAIRAREQVTGKHIPIIAMTAHAMVEDRNRCLEAGMDDHIAKPISTKVLYEKLTEIERGKL
jgi:PAS domain S-box-containing protein